MAPGGVVMCRVQSDHLFFLSFTPLPPFFRYSLKGDVQTWLQEEYNKGRARARIWPKLVPGGFFCPARVFAGSKERD